MRNTCLVFVGSLKREAPHFQGARGVGLGVYSFDEATLETQKRANDIDNPTFLSVTPDARQSTPIRKSSLGVRERSRPTASTVARARSPIAAWARPMMWPD